MRDPEQAIHIPSHENCASSNISSQGYTLSKFSQLSNIWEFAIYKHVRFSIFAKSALSLNFPLLVCLHMFLLFKNWIFYISNCYTYISRQLNLIFFIRWIQSTPRKQFFWIKETFLWYTVKEKISLNWRKFCWF